MRLPTSAHAAPAGVGAGLVWLVGTTSWLVCGSGRRGWFWVWGWGSLCGPWQPAIGLERVLMVGFGGCLKVGFAWGVGLLAGTFCVMSWPAAALAGGCPDEGVRALQVRGGQLPDCREYVQVSPVQKEGVDAKGFPGKVEASPSGSRFSYYSIEAFPGACSVEGTFPIYMGLRGGEGSWSTESLLPCEAHYAEKLGFSEDLSDAFIEVEGVSLTAQALPGRNYYVRYSEPLGGVRYRWLARPETNLYFAGFSSDDQHLLVESEAQLAVSAAVGAPNVFAADLDAPVENQWSLVGVIPPEEKDESCGPGGPACVTPAEGSVAGAGASGWKQLPECQMVPHPFCHDHYTQSAVSEDGSRVFFTAFPSGRVYLREDGERTVAVSAGAAHFWAATPDGSFAFYTEDGSLYRFEIREGGTGVSVPVAVTAEATGDITAGSGEVTRVGVSAGVFHVGETLFGVGVPAGARITAVRAGSLVLSAPASETRASDALSGSPADVAGVLGVSADGATVYFAAGGTFAQNTREYEYTNAKGEHITATEAAANESEVHRGLEEVFNLYSWYQPPLDPPVSTFVTRLSDQGGPGEAGEDNDELDWVDFPGQGFPTFEKTSRVSADGSTVLFASRLSLTGYDNDNDNANCHGNGHACSELFRYRAGAGGSLGRVLCVSCNPDVGVAPAGSALLTGEGGGTYGGGTERWLTRNLSVDGGRVFFESPDALVAGDVDPGPSPSCEPPGSGVAVGCDVYEWEADGEGSCASEVQDGGCVFLISSGTASEQSYLGDASANGDDVFFFTRQTLVPSDIDDSVDVYDARGCSSGEAWCEETPLTGTSACSGEGCAGAYTPPPSVGSLGSTAPSGSGNLPEPSPSPGAGGTPKHLTVAQELAAALRKCRSQHKSRRRRRLCEARAHKHYPAKTSRKRKHE